jgi:hypothetical protein
MGDLLSAASLLLTLIALLYGMWYSEIVAATNLTVQPQPSDRLLDYQRANGVFWTKAIPLTAAALLLSAVFLPTAVQLISRAIKHSREVGLSAIRDYDPVAMSLILVTAGAILFSIHLFSLSRQLRVHVLELKS